MDIEQVQKLSWLAGIVDGEGSIGVYISKTNQKHNNLKYTSVHVVYQFTVANTNSLIIKKVHSIVSEILGETTPPTAIQVVEDKRASRTNSRIGYCVNVKDHKGIIKVLTALVPYLVGKQSQAEVMLHLLKNHQRHTKYTKVELEIIELLKKMKKHNTTAYDGNAELNSDLQSDKCAEHIEETTQSELPFGNF